MSGALSLLSSIFSFNRAEEIYEEEEELNAFCRQTASGGAIYLNLIDIERWQLRRPLQDNIGDFGRLGQEGLNRAPTASPTLSPTVSPTISPTTEVGIPFAHVAPRILMANLTFTENAAAVGGGGMFLHFYKTAQVQLDTDIIRNMEDAALSKCCSFTNNSAEFADEVGTLPAEIFVESRIAATGSQKQSYQVGEQVKIEVRSNDFFQQEINGGHTPLRVLATVTMEDDEMEFSITEEVSEASFDRQHRVVAFLEQGDAVIVFKIFLR